MDVRVRRGLVGLAVIIGLWLLAGALQLAGAARDLQGARADLSAVEDAAFANDLVAVTERLDDAAGAFGSARRRLDGVAVASWRALPVARGHVRVVRHLSGAGEKAARAGRLVAGHIAELPGGVAALAPSGGGLPIDTYDSLVDPVRHADGLLASSARELQRTVGIPVVDRLDAARREALDLVPGAADAVHRAAVILPVLDELLGADEPRRYLFLAQNPAEIRGTGGFIGAYSLLTMDQGRFEFGEFNEIQDLPAFPATQVVPPSAEFSARYREYGGAGFWHNINMTPDFPTAARAMEALYAKGTGQEVDGVIAVDPFALEALLKIAGPVDVPGFGLVAADDVVEVVSNRAHDEIRDSEARKALLGTVAVGAFDGFLRAEGAERPLETAETLMDVMREGHLLLRSAHPHVQSALLTSQVAGALIDPPGDFVAVVANAGSAAKLDYYMERTLDYDVRLQADGAAAARLETTFVNRAPAEGVSARVIGPNVEGLEAGEQRLVVSIYAPADAAVDAFSRTTGERALVVGDDLGRTVLDTVIEIPSGQSQALTAAWRRPDGWSEAGGGGIYRLHLQGQPTLRETAARVEVTVPPGMVVTGFSPAMEQRGADRVAYTGELGGIVGLEVTFGPEGGTGLLGRLRRWWSRPLIGG